MTQTTYTDNVKIDGSQDITQLDVEGHSTQTEPLQQWSENGGDPLARVTGDGRLQVGSFDSGAMVTDDSLIEAHRDEADTSKPTRGLHLLGEITGTLSSVISWVVQELVLKGTGGISALHSALRVKLTNENTGTMDAGAELRAGDFEVVNDGGSSGDGVTLVTGVRTAVTNNSGAYIDTAVGLDVELADAGTMTDAYGIRVADVDQGSGDNFAIKTGAGAIRFGDLGEGLIKASSNGDLSSLKTNFSATTAPTEDDDSGDGYAVGSKWYDTTNDRIYECIDASSGAAVWIESSSYEMVIPWTTVGSSQSSINITDIPATGNTLHLKALLRTDNSGSWDYIDIRPNNDTSSQSNYQGIYVVGYGGNVTQAENYSGGTSPRKTIGSHVNWFPASGAPSGSYVFLEMSIANFANTSMHKFVQYHYFSPHANSGTYRSLFMDGGSTWLSNTAITSLYLEPINGTYFESNSKYALWRS